MDASGSHLVDAGIANVWVFSIAIGKERGKLQLLVEELKSFLAQLVVLNEHQKCLKTSLCGAPGAVCDFFNHFLV